MCLRQIGYGLCSSLRAPLHPITDPPWNFAVGLAGSSPELARGPKLWSEEMGAGGPRPEWGQSLNLEVKITLTLFKVLKLNWGPPIHVSSSSAIGLHSQINFVVSSVLLRQRLGSATKGTAKWSLEVVFLGSITEEARTESFIGACICVWVDLDSQTGPGF